MPSINGVEIFSVGEWNGDKYTASDLDEMVKAFNDTKDHVRPFLKLGHDEEQKLLQADGLPAAGWISNIYTKGEKLLADFVDIPKKVMELIKKKAYRNVSSEVYWDIDVDGKVYKRMLAAVALLGADTPGVMNLSDILAQYKKNGLGDLKIYANQENELIIKKYNYQINDDHGGKMTEQEIQELKDRAAKAEKEAQEAKSAREEAEKKYSQTEAELKKTEIEKQVNEFEVEFKTPPSAKPYIKELFGEEKKTYTVTSKDKSEKKLTKYELVGEILKLYKASDVNLEERSKQGDKGKKNFTIDQITEKIKTYQKDNDCTYKEAHLAVVKSLDTDYMDKVAVEPEDDDE